MSKLRIMNYELRMRRFCFAKRFSGRSSSHKGFTLIELVISLGIFIIFLGIVSTSYLSIVRAQQQANAVRKMYSEVRNFMEMLSQDMRLGTLDYDCYEPHLASANNSNPDTFAKCPADVAGLISVSPDGTSPYLAIVNKENTEKTVYWFDAQNHKIKLRKFIPNANGWSPAPEYDPSALDSSDGFQTLLSDDLVVDNLTFAVYPAINPYSSDPDHFLQNQSQFQPKVTVFFSVKNASSKLPPFSLNLQTTLSSRVYNRQS